MNPNPRLQTRGSIVKVSCRDATDGKPTRRNSEIARLQRNVRLQMHDGANARPGEESDSVPEAPNARPALMSPKTFKKEDMAKRKKSLSHWAKYSTVSWRMDAQKDYDEHTSRVVKIETKFRVWFFEATTWLLPALIGFLTATSGTFIEKGVEFFSDLRFGHCTQNGGFNCLPEKDCPQGNWTVWTGHAGVDDAPSTVWLHGLGIYSCFSVAFAVTAALMCWGIAPTARGSGIPEVKTVLGGFVMADVLSFKTLVVKIVGLCLSVSSGMALGKEGPLVHVACCWANVCSYISPRYRQNEGKRRDLLSTAAASGVSVAFGAPLGGVLFSYEEVSTMFPQKTMVRAFFGAVVAAVSLAWYDPTGTGKLTMFQTNYPNPPVLLEYFGFVFIGVLGGLIGSLFVHLNVQVTEGRGEGTKFRKWCHVVLEVFFISVFTALTNYPSKYTRPLSSTTIHGLFLSCENNLDRGAMFSLCDETNLESPNVSWQLMGMLLLAALIRLIQLTFTFGTGVPAGLFVPSLYAGACLGRVCGMLMWLFNSHVFQFTTNRINPGVYAMVGAAAVLGGVCRVTISLVVIMFELTGGLQFVVPFMLAVLTAKWVGDSFTGGIYDCYIRIRGYPFLHEPDDVTYSSRALDIMDEELECIVAEPITIKQLYEEISSSKHSGFPLIQSQTDRTLLGYIHKQQLKERIEKERQHQFVQDETLVFFGKYMDANKKPHGIDLSKLIDETVVRVVSETPLAQVHNIFRQLGVKVVMIVQFAELKGMITKKGFVDHMHTLAHPRHEEHHAVAPSAVVASVAASSGSRVARAAAPSAVVVAPAAAPSAVVAPETPGDGNASDVSEEWSPERQCSASSLQGLGAPLLSK